MLGRLTRRNLLLSVVGAASGIAQQNRKHPELPRVGEFVRYVDPVTENTLVRLTSLSSSNQLPAPHNHFVSSRDRLLAFSSDRSGAFTPHLLDLRTGVIRQLAEASALDPLSLTFEQGERTLFYLDGGALKQVQISNRHVTTIAEGISSFTGRSESTMLMIRDGQLQSLRRQIFATDVSGPCQLSPDGAFCLVRRAMGADCEFWCVPLRSSGPPRLLASGRIRFPFWSPDSQTILFLRDIPGNGIELSEIHRVGFDGSAEDKVSPTSQFASFSPNGNATVFVGASRSKAQPTVDLLLRSAKREMTLCEHHASKPSSVAPVFAPDSKRVYFQSDREGKLALYSINVELLVEPTIS